MKNWRIILKINLCTPGAVDYNVCKFCKDLMCSFWVLGEQTDIYKRQTEPETFLQDYKIRYHHQMFFWQILHVTIEGPTPNVISKCPKHSSTALWILRVRSWWRVVMMLVLRQKYPLIYKIFIIVWFLPCHLAINNSCILRWNHCNSVRMLICLREVWLVLW